jgi:hypothetical protein
MRIEPARNEAAAVKEDSKGQQAVAIAAFSDRPVEARRNRAACRGNHQILFRRDGVAGRKPAARGEHRAVSGRGELREIEWGHARESGEHGLRLGIERHLVS